MKFIKITLFDLRNGLIQNKMLFLCPAVISAVTFFAFMNRIQKLVSDGTLQKSRVAFGDYWFYLYGGMKEYTPSFTDPFLFPIIWIIVFLTIPFLLVNYPMKDMQDYGQQVLIHARGRTSWWLSKCFWNISCTVVYHMVLILTMILLCFLSGVPITNSIHGDILKHTFELPSEVVWIGLSMLPLAAILLPVVVSVSTNLLQMTISLFLKPVFSFLIITVLMLSSAYLSVPYLIGNYAMPIRYQWFSQEGEISHNIGLFLSILRVVISVIIGLFRFRYYDILSRE